MEVNPFWSERVVGDILLQQHRPRELPPVPDGSVETRSRSGSTRRGTPLGNGKGVGGPDQGAPIMPRRKRSRSFGRKEAEEVEVLDRRLSGLHRVVGANKGKNEDKKSREAAGFSQPRCRIK